VLVEHAPRVALLPALASLLLVIAIKARHHRDEGQTAQEADRTVAD
jgi:hypothetical protein